MSDDLIDDLDIFDDATPEVTEEGLGRMAAMFERRSVVAEKAEELKAELSVVEEELRMIDERDFPALFEEVGLEAFEIAGQRLEVADKVLGSLPRADEEKRESALEYLKSLDGDKLLKVALSMAFDKGSEDEARRVHEMLDAAGIPHEVKEDVHPSTLAAFAREMLESGREIDLARLGLRVRRALKITKQRKKR